MTQTGPASTAEDFRRAAHEFLGGKAISFAEATALWKGLKQADELSLARRVVERLRAGGPLVDKVPRDRLTKATLCQQEALLTSKDPELSAATRHDRAMDILFEEFDLHAPAVKDDAETLGIAGGIHKRRWSDLGQIEDLRKAAEFYQRGAGKALGDDAYAHINAAFTDDLLAHIGDDADARKGRARSVRKRILRDLPTSGTWWNAATRAEALFGLGRYIEAADVVARTTEKPSPWQLQSTTRQLAHLAHLHHPQPLRVPDVVRFFDVLLPGAEDAARSAVMGKVGLALSGGGFRAGLYHLGVLARLAELNVLRNVDVLSCVSGGSIVGACYWLALRKRLLQADPMTHEAYILLIKDLIDHFLNAVVTDLRHAAQEPMRHIMWRVLSGEKGLMDPEKAATALDEHFYRPLMEGTDPICMHDLPFTPRDHDESLAGSPTFHPTKHNWLRAHKVPVLVINATTVNTAHAWQFTPTWMGESPWAVHAEADSLPRLEWSWYVPEKGWTMELGRAVAASACVPGAFSPLEIGDAYADVNVQLVDGGVHDNQGTTSLLALDCNVLLVSDACGQLMLERQNTPGAKGLVSYAKRSMDTLMERVRLACFGDLSSRQRAGLVRGLMFLHMKAGLDADTIHLSFSQESYQTRREILSPSGVRKDFQQALSELRTDLDAFTEEESHALMACGYQMASWSFSRSLQALLELWEGPLKAEWPFGDMLMEITSTAATTPRRDEFLKKIRAGALSEFECARPLARPRRFVPTDKGVRGSRQNGRLAN